MSIINQLINTMEQPIIICWLYKVIYQNDSSAICCLTDLDRKNHNFSSFHNYENIMLSYDLNLSIETTIINGEYTLIDTPDNQCIIKKATELYYHVL